MPGWDSLVAVAVDIEGPGDECFLFLGRKRRRHVLDVLLRSTICVSAINRRTYPLYEIQVKRTWPREKAFVSILELRSVIHQPLVQGYNKIKTQFYAKAAPQGLDLISRSFWREQLSYTQTYIFDTIF